MCRTLYIGLLMFLGLIGMLPVAAQELCTDGVLLFREDFEGNNPSDPTYGSKPVSGMSSNYSLYQGSMGSGVYLLTKKGYRNGIQWHRQDDHTYPDDFTRGYFLEVDGKGGSDPFFSTKIDNLCAGTKLTFSAYVVNITYAGQIPYLQQNFGYVYPRMRFVLKDSNTGRELASKSTGDILPDDRYSTEETWKYARDNELSAEWQLVGMTFEVPQGVEDIQMYIYNDCENGMGNDFGLDDIEIHLCAPSVHLVSPHNVCEGRHYRFKIDFQNNGVMQEPLEFQWFYARELDPTKAVDDNNWTPINRPEGKQLNMNYGNVTEADSGWYRLAIASEGNLDKPQCRSISEPFHLSVNADCPVCTDGRLILREELGGTAPATYTHTIEGVCGGTEFSMIANIADRVLADDAHLTLVITDADTQDELKRYEADKAELEDWRYAGFNFAVPVGVGNIAISILNDALVEMENIEVYLCAPEVEVTLSETEVCRESDALFSLDIHDGPNERLAFMDPIEYQWFHSADNNEWTPITGATASTCHLWETTDADNGWYKVAVAEAGNIGSAVCRAESEAVYLTIKKCLKPPQTKDTTVCDTLMPYPWHAIEWTQAGDSTILYHYSTGEDSIAITYILRNIHCCPSIESIRMDSAICDTLLPFEWTFGDTTLTYLRPEGQAFEYPHERWTTCTGKVYTFVLDTFHCERLYPIIVNKYNRVLLCNNALMAQLFPELQISGYQWYKDGEAIEGATEGNYSEEDELQGAFQLRVRMDNNQFVWSRVLQLTPTTASAEQRLRIYNHYGLMIYEATDDMSCPSLPRGIYILIFEQDGEHISQKKMIL